MSRFIEGHDRHQPSLLPPCVDDYVPPEALVRVAAFPRLVQRRTGTVGLTLQVMVK